MSNATKINLDTSSRVDVTCRKGDTFSLRLTVTNSTGGAAFKSGDVFLFEVRHSDIGDHVKNTDNVNFAASVTADSDDVTAKFIDITVAASVMKTMPSGLYIYDVEQKTAAVVSTLIFGTLKVNEDVSITA